MNEQRTELSGERWVDDIGRAERCCGAGRCDIRLEGVEGLGRERQTLRRLGNTGGERRRIGKRLLAGTLKRGAREKTRGVLRALDDAIPGEAVKRRAQRFLSLQNRLGRCALDNEHLADIGRAQFSAQLGVEREAGGGDRAEGIEVVLPAWASEED